MDSSRGLGLLSIALGAAALLAPRSVGRLTGLGDRNGLLRMVGLRELASGVGLLTQSQTTPWLWSRVAGDAMDLAVLGTALRPGNAGRGRAMGALAAVAAITALDVAASLRETSRQRSAPLLRAREPLVEHTIIVGKSPQDCYAFWRNVSNLAKFSPMLQSVTALDERRSHWVLKGPARAPLEWDAEITVDRPGERIAWHSLPGAQVAHAGVVRFEAAPGKRGTLVRVMMHYQPPAGRVGAGLAKLLGSDPNTAVREDLRRFKSLLEAGEIPTTRGQPSGRRSVLGRMMPEGRKSRQGAEA